MVLPGLIPMWVVFSYTIFGDLSAGFVVIALAVTLYRVVAPVAAGEPVRLRDGALVGLLAIIALYLSSSALPSSAGALVLLAVAVVIFGCAQRLTRRLAVTALAAVVFLIALAPWSIAASKVFDTRVITTTDLNLSLAVTFGNTGELCFGPCTPNQAGAYEIWFDAPRYAREVSAATGESEVTVQQSMSHYALRGVTTSHLVRSIRRDYDNYLGAPNAFASRFSPNAPTAVTKATTVMYGAAAAIAALVLLDLRRLALRHRISRMLVKLLLLASMTQPFVHPASGRYWPSFVPLFGLAVGFALTTWRRSAAESAGELPVGSRAAGRAVVVADVAATSIAVVVTVLLLALAR